MGSYFVANYRLEQQLNISLNISFRIINRVFLAQPISDQITIPRGVLASILLADQNHTTDYQITFLNLPFLKIF